MNKIYHLIIISVLLLLLLGCSQTEQMGKLYTPEEADKLFGKVLYSTELPTSVLSNLLKKTDSSIMFGLINEQLIVLDKNRNLLYPERAEYKDSDVFTVYSTEIVNKLISENNPESVSVEQRKEVLSVSTKTSTLERGFKCPPDCP